MKGQGSEVDLARHATVTCTAPKPLALQIRLRAQRMKCLLAHTGEQSAGLFQEPVLMRCVHGYGLAIWLGDFTALHCK